MFGILSEGIKQNFEKDFHLQYISSDKIRGEYIKELMSNNKTTFSEAMEKSQKGKTFKNRFNTEMKSLIQNIDRSKINLIFVDKNYPPEAIKKFPEYI